MNDLETDVPVTRDPAKTEQLVTSALLHQGWMPAEPPDGTGTWRHPKLHFQWPRSDAVRLTNEAFGNAGDARALLLFA